jgi:hypothetical protein
MARDVDRLEVAHGPLILREPGVDRRTRLGGSEETVTTYTYTKQWSSSAIDSSAFAEPAGHENPEMSIKATEIYARDATLGAYSLGDSVLSQVGGDQPLPLNAASEEAIQAAAGRIDAPGRRSGPEVQQRQVGPCTPVSKIDCPDGRPIEDQPVVSFAAFQPVVTGPAHQRVVARAAR